MLGGDAELFPKIISFEHTVIPEISIALIAGHDMLRLLYPPHPRTEQATMRDGLLCMREGVTINIFLLPSWNQTREDIYFAHRLAEPTRGRVFFTTGRDLDRYVLWDYVYRKNQILSG